jgi:hypothetical protein
VTSRSLLLGACHYWAVHRRLAGAVAPRPPVASTPWAYGPPPGRYGSAIEIERKFLVAEPPSDLEQWPSTSIAQGYLAVGDDGT